MRPVSSTLHDLPDGVRQSALRQQTRYNWSLLASDNGTLRRAIDRMCYWDETSEGSTYWWCVWQRYKELSYQHQTPVTSYPEP